VATHAGGVANLVRSSGAHLGAVIDPDGEHITLIDDEGHVLTDTESLLTLVTLLGQTAEAGSRIAVPVAAPAEVGTLAATFGLGVIETKMSTSALMESAGETGVVLAASLDGGFIFPKYLPAFDALAAFSTVLELLARTDGRLSKIVATLPRTHVVHEVVPTPSEHKGAVMRSLVETADAELELIDGVKVRYDDGWALVLPDPEDPVCHVWAEAGSDSDARRRAQDYVGRIRRLLR
jgi:mannose-1-phosphate guanylyltransferase/phosphomannomutase